MKIRCMTGAFALALAGCVSVGTKIDPNVVGTFQPGVTTIADAESKLGQPNQTSRLPDGSTMIVYSFVHAQASGSSYIPIAGAFVGHTDSSNVMAMLTFDPKGRFVSYTSSQGQTSAGMLSHN